MQWNNFYDTLSISFEERVDVFHLLSAIANNNDLGAVTAEALIGVKMELTDPKDKVMYPFEIKLRRVQIEKGKVIFEIEIEEYWDNPPGLVPGLHKVVLDPENEGMFHHRTIVDKNGQVPVELVENPMSYPKAVI